MFKKFSIAVMCIVVLLSIAACGPDTTSTADSTEAPTSVPTEKPTAAPTEKPTAAPTEPTATPTEPTENTSVTNTTTPPVSTNGVFDTEDVIRITFYAYYGGGKGSDVPAENMTEIINWLGSFTLGEKAPNILPPGTNTYYVEIEYSDGMILKNGLDTRTIDGNTYYLESNKKPECFMEIISKTSLN